MLVPHKTFISLYSILTKNNVVERVKYRNNKIRQKKIQKNKVEVVLMYL